MSVGKYSSYMKSLKDLLNKPYSYDNKVELKTQASNGAKFTSDASIKDKDGSAAGNLKVEYKQGNFSVDKLAISTDKTITGEFKLAGAAPNTDFTFKCTDGSRSSGADISAGIGAVYKDDAFTVTADADVINGPNFDFTGVFAYQGFLVGGATKVSTNFLSAADAASKDSKDAAAAPVAVSDYNVLLGYKTSDFTVAAQTTKALSHVDVTLLHTASKDLEAGTIASFDVKGGSTPFGITLGGKYKLDSDSSIAGAVDSTGKISLNYSQKLSDFATIKASGQVDSLALDSDSHKFGLTLCLGN
eukprot:CAMPEP_0185578258 /NCGR_PEP_ID=MMETSP0434-20130131/12426_1 /TAXON_ID=626734 ORGANISM="Favella taraikaensis, Strain Fe Narragansett Bay" /NCGR_SAMPLE_ID=MMETSP0434 /ASSEMBLY_ACC=CAM_ASM_000379 /LENGTH=301 /DNA_ID=CAMNT_0028196017 /DNA_START=32 /DNA_END=937 /DNA_ORIENTATION=+